MEQIESQWMLAGNAPWTLSVQQVGWLPRSVRRLELMDHPSTPPPTPSPLPQVTSCTAGTFGCGGGDTVTAYDQLISGATKFG